MKFTKSSYQSINMIFLYYLEWLASSFFTSCLIRRALKIEIYHIIYFQDSDKETYGAIYELGLKIKSWNTAMSRFQL